MFLFFNMGQSWQLFYLFSSFSDSNYKNRKSVDGVGGIRTQGHRMVVADETTENTCGVTVLVALVTLACVRIWQFFGFN